MRSVLFLLAIMSGVAFGDDLTSKVHVVQVKGQVQFWQRHCDAHGTCELPKPISDKIDVAGSLAQPSGPGKLSQYSTKLDGTSAKANFSVYWVIPPDNKTPYLVTQVKLVQGELPLSECTQYAGTDSQYFPVGACSGFVADSAGTQQIGISFFK